MTLCGISRQTFYYHFEDVLDVVDWWTRQGAQYLMEESLRIEDPHTALRLFVDYTTDNRQTLPRFQPEAIRQNLRIVEVLNQFGRTRGYTPAQIALAWLMHKGEFIVPIPGTTKLAHLEENLRATEITFTPEEMQELEQAVSAIPVVGSRYDALQESKVQK